MQLWYIDAFLVEWNKVRYAMEPYSARKKKIIEEAAKSYKEVQVNKGRQTLV